MTDTSITDNVTPLRPTKAKRTDNTAALRQRRSRAKRKLSVTVPGSQLKSELVEKPSNIKAMSRFRAECARRRCHGRNAVTPHQLRPCRHRVRLLSAGHRDQCLERHGGRHDH
jgi:hypothetical protein